MAIMIIEETVREHRNHHEYRLRQRHDTQWRDAEASGYATG